MFAYVQRSTRCKVGGFREDGMARYSFTASELETFYGVLDSLVCEVSERGIPLSVYDMIARLFTGAERGEGDPKQLRQAVLRDAADETDGHLLPARRFGAGASFHREFSPREVEAA